MVLGSVIELCLFLRSKFITHFGILILIFDLLYDNPSFPQIVLVLNNLLLIVLILSDSQQGGGLSSKAFIRHFIRSS